MNINKLLGWCGGMVIMVAFVAVCGVVWTSPKPTAVNDKVCETFEPTNGEIYPRLVLIHRVTLKVTEDNLEAIKQINERERQYLEMIEALNVRQGQAEYLLGLLIRRAGVTEPACAGGLTPPELLPMPHIDGPRSQVPLPVPPDCCGRDLDCCEDLKPCCKGSGIAVTKRR